MGCSPHAVLRNTDWTIHVRTCYIVARMTLKHVKAAKKEMIRARCDESLKNDITRVAMLKQLDEADIIRIACFNFVQQYKNPDLKTGTNG